MKQNKLPLPIDAHIPEVLKAVSDYSTVIVKASPGTGKTTRLPWAIANQISGKVAVLEPRRLAAKLAAMRICDEEGFVLGEEVGHHFRFEKKITSNTKLIFYTEGTFLKKFLSSNDLDGVEVFILDEFHERHLETDLALSYLRALQKIKHIKIILMSATIDTSVKESFLDSKVIEISVNSYPVDIHFLPNQPSILIESLELKVKKAVEATQDDTLVFLPGMREMLKVQSALNGPYEVMLLHADLSKEEQARALHPIDKRKIILATNIAESSVTIPGIKVVIDSGIQREAKYSAWSGLKLIQDSPITKSSAIQRAGRAGRTAPGVCYRLYSQLDFQERQEHTIPEIERADLTDVCLLTHSSSLKPEWQTPPSEDRWQKAIELLRMMKAIDDTGITSIGKKMLEFPLEARLSRILIDGETLNSSEKKKLLQYICYDIEKDRSGTLYQRLNSYLKTSGNDNHWERCLLAGFPDQLARFRPKQRDFIHYSGKTIKAHSSLTDLVEGYYVILDITQRQEAIQTVQIEEDWIWSMDPFPFTEEEEIVVEEKVTLKRKTKLGSIVFEENSITPRWSELPNSLKEKISTLTVNTFNARINSFKESNEFQRILLWSKYNDVPLDFLENITPQDYFEQMETLSLDNLENFLQIKLGEKIDLAKIERDLPKKINLGGRRDIEVHYPSNGIPYLEAPIQDFYGLNKTPNILQGKLRLTLKLLGPHKRPIQITSDLESFWQRAYQEIKKEYQRDYPRHYWPDKPWEAKPYLLKSHLPKA